MYFIAYICVTICKKNYLVKLESAKLVIYLDLLPESSIANSVHKSGFKPLLASHPYFPSSALLSWLDLISVSESVEKDEEASEREIHTSPEKK